MDHTQPYVILDNTNLVTLDRCWFESWGADDAQYFIQLTDIVRCVEVRTTRFVRNDDVSTARVVTVDGVGRSILLVNLDISLGVMPTGADDVRIQNADSEVVMIGGLISEPASYHPIRVTGAPALSAWVGTSGRVRVPQVPNSEALTDVANGDIVYNSSTNKLNIRVNEAWAGISTTTP